MIVIPGKHVSTLPMYLLVHPPRQCTSPLSSVTMLVRRRRHQCGNCCRCSCFDGVGGPACDTCSPGRVGAKCLLPSVFSQSHYNVSVSETAPIATRLLTLNATRRDNDTVRYSIVGGQAGLPFRMQPVSGKQKGVCSFVRT